MANRSQDPQPVHFLVPIYDRDGNPYPVSVHEQLRKDLEDRFDGWSSLGDVLGEIRNLAKWNAMTHGGMKWVSCQVGFKNWMIILPL